MPSGYTKTGYFVIVGPEDRDAMLENVAMQRAAGVDTSIVTAEDVQEIAPMVRTFDGESFAYEPESGYADPYSVTTGYANAARDRGARILSESPAVGIEITANRVTAVLTESERIEAPIAVVAAGPWSGPLLASIGVEVPLRPIRHQVIMLRRPQDVVPDHPIIGDVVNDMSPRPDAGNLTLIGVGEDEEASPDTFNQGVDMPMVEATFEKLVQRMPGMAQALFRGGWSGLFTTTPDWHPVLDSVNGIDGLYLSVGFSGHGFKLSPMIGVVMSELITQGSATSLDISEMSLDRFAEGRLMRSRYSMQVLA